MPDYSQGKIYKLLNYETDDVYVGCTTQLLCQRLAKHKQNLTDPRKCTTKLYTKMEELGPDKFYIELIENFNCNSKEELNAKEREWIRKIGTLSTYIAVEL